MFTHRARTRAVRRQSRTLLRSWAGLVFLALVATMSPALADTPQQWENSPEVTWWDAALILLIIPGGIALVLTVLSLLGSLRSGKRAETGQAWRGEGQWFGGPKKGVAAADEVERDKAHSGESGGTSARW